MIIIHDKLNSPFKMSTVLLSELERYYIIQGAELGCRTDGRASNEYRPLELGTGVLSHASGSASIRIGETHIMGCVKVEVGKPQLSRPSEGVIEINVECYPTAISGSTEKAAKEVAESLKSTLQNAYRADLVDLRHLCIVPGRQCWVVYIDLLLLEGGGNFLDAASIVVKAALMDSTRLLVNPGLDRSSTKESTAQKQEQNLLPYFDEKRLPVFVTVHKVGSSHLVDPCTDEEACSLSRLSVAVYPDGSLGSLLQEGCGSCQLETIVEMSEVN
ncbi:unnamed protein product [Calicophoron daubneyi]|uniref:Ribosomal RNA-processing protein 42 n=1 Tax=Calicophoron daubneyi TaxID=300641 RepID=A0AAV2T8Y2_CALDB